MSDAAQRWDAARYAQTARFVTDLGAPLLELLAPRAGERILDLGCGDGPLTKQIAERGCIVVGVDASPEMVRAACALGLDARVMDGTALRFDGGFDAVFSNAALHWMKPPERVIAGVWRALEPGGRFVGECGGKGNVAAVIAGLEAALAPRGIDARAASPWVFPDADTYRGLLEAQGFRVDSIGLFARPTPLPGHLADWLQTFAQSFVAAVPPEERLAVYREAAEASRGALCDSEGRWRADYVRLRFVASKPASLA